MPYSTNFSPFKDSFQSQQSFGFVFVFCHWRLILVTLKAYLLRATGVHPLGFLRSGLFITGPQGHLFLPLCGLVLCFGGLSRPLSTVVWFNLGLVSFSSVTLLGPIRESFSVPFSTSLHLTLTFYLRDFFMCIWRLIVPSRTRLYVFGHSDFSLRSWYNIPCTFYIYDRIFDLSLTTGRLLCGLCYQPPLGHKTPQLVPSPPFPSLVVLPLLLCLTWPFDPLLCH